MSDVLIPYGGGTGADLDLVTVSEADVRRGKVFVDRNGNPITGNMAEKAAATYTPGTFDQTISENQYLTGVQTIKGDPNLLAQYIKKGVTIFGVAGTFQGWVGDAGDLYINGANNAGFTVSEVILQQDRIDLAAGRIPTLTSTKSYTLVQNQKLTIVGSIQGSFGSGGAGRLVFELKDESGEIIAEFDGRNQGYYNGFSFTMPRTLTFKPVIKFTYAANGWRGYINRIYI